MTTDQAHTAVSTSALIVGGIYLYRHLIEGENGNRKPGKGTAIVTGGNPPSVAEFVIAWGLIFLILSVTAEALPDLGGWFAILVAVGAVLNNGQSVLNDTKVNRRR